MTRFAITLLVATLIRGDVGNKPVADPGWPKGAAVIFNHPDRIAWWEGPPFGGGQWHAECRGDALALSGVLADFARMEAKVKRVVLHDGTGQSFWLAPNNEPAKLAAARIDWVFMTWQSANWERLRQMPVDLNPIPPGEGSPPSQIDVYTGNLKWADVTVPPGIEVVDGRLVSHGFTEADGVVIEGKTFDLETRKPVAATMTLQRVETPKQGGYRYPDAAEAKADAQGRWVLKNAPMGWARVVVAAEGYVPRVVGYGQFDQQPRWQSYECGLARPASVSGRVIDEQGKPLAGVDVRFDDVQAKTGGRYKSPDDFKALTDSEGRFASNQLPAGRASIFLMKPGYVRPGLGPNITPPQAGIELTMKKAAGIRVTVDFEGKERPAGYILMIAPEGGEVVGSYGGSAQIDAKNQHFFEILPPGRYVLTGRPNPSTGNQTTEAVTVDAKGGRVAEITLKAR